MDVLILEILSIHLKVGDVLELALIDKKFATEQMIEIPIACKLVKKDAIVVHFHHHELDLDFNTVDIHSKNDHRYLTIHSLEIVDPEKGYLVINEEDGAVRYQVAWKKISTTYE
ncbi:hypothetical protein [Acaryochloris marina]|uniref:Uncharacterized protein n=1 Tax=Acaryochloris marina (strain MBIC 11017) TaxID=329726 RepID=A8ZPZ8_ACAM1|nr:hypothetical protein [Acaryochloris marina]ABW33167.1 hypothetical protein AM1_F0015 [Acaryochloris marina MBIC11017]